MTNYLYIIMLFCIFQGCNFKAKKAIILYIIIQIITQVMFIKNVFIVV